MVKNKDADSNRQSVRKKQYTEPVLRVYGNIQDLTRTTTHLGGSSDTRGPAMDTRTH
jgi:hypothetical protein